MAWLEQAYATTLMPAKLALDLNYVRRRTVWWDISGWWDSQHALGEDLDTVEHEAEVPCAELVPSGFDGGGPPIADLLSRRPSSVATAAAAAIRDALAATGMAALLAGDPFASGAGPEHHHIAGIDSGPPRHPTRWMMSPLYPPVYPSGYFSRYVSIWSFRSAFAS